MEQQVRQQSIITRNIYPTVKTQEDYRRQISWKSDESSVVKSPESLKDSYLFIRQLGHGAQARVFLAVRLADGINVAIKQLNIESVKNWKEYDLFHREAQLLESLKIEGVARFYEAIECLNDKPPCSYIIQEYIEGVSLGQMLKDSHRFKITEICDILYQLLKILYQLQNRPEPVIHRDIKPSNIMLKPGVGEYKATLIDFGAVANPQVQGGGSTVAGTYGYMPPEQMMGKPVPASDIYSLGAVAVQLFTGKSPADMPIKDFHLIFEPDMEQFPPELIATLRGMLEPKVENRLSDVKDLLHRFERYKNNQFEKLSGKAEEDAKKMEALCHKLQLVRTTSDVGNMNLWQSLPDSIPRHLPQFFCDGLTKSSPLVQKKESLPLRIVKAINKLPTALQFILLTPLLIALLIIVFVGIPYLIYQMLVFLFGEAASTALSSILYVGFVFVCIIIQARRTYGSKSSNLSNPSALSDSNYLIFDVLWNIIKNGRKTVAIITDIKYIPLNETVVPKKGLYVCNKNPKFLIKYKFNPPDDSKGDVDLVHECVVNHEPEGNYSVGDPLPILYSLDNNYIKETVSSVPFPFPYADFDPVSMVTIVENILQHRFENNIETSSGYKLYIEPLLEAANDRHKLISLLSNNAYIYFLDDNVKKLFIEFASKILRINDELLHYYIMKSLVEKPDLMTYGEGLVYDFVMSYLQGNIAQITRGGLTGCLDKYNFYNYPYEFHKCMFSLMYDNKNKMLFDVIVNACCSVMYSNKNNSKMFADMFVTYFNSFLSKGQTPDPYIVNAFLSNIKFRDNMYQDEYYRKIVTALRECYKNAKDSNNLVSQCLDKYRTYTIRERVNVKMLQNPDNLPVLSMIVESLCSKFDSEFLDYLEACDKAGSVPPEVMMGIAYFTRTNNFKENDTKAIQYQVDFFRILLDMFKNKKMEPWFKYMMEAQAFDSLYQCYFSRFPVILAPEVFEDKLLKDYYPFVFDSNFHCYSVDLLVTAIENYFSRDLKEDVSLHIRVYETIYHQFRYSSQKWSHKNRQRLKAICKDICDRGAPELVKVVKGKPFN